MVVIHLHTLLQIKTEQGLLRRVEQVFSTGMTLSMAIAQLGILVDEENVLLVVNGHLAEMDHELADGDEVHLIPALSGG
jgi:molybdopterin converting factor small subunit